MEYSFSNRSAAALWALALPLAVAGCTPDDSTALELEDCSNEIDDDGNGLIDCQDPRCTTDARCLKEAECGNLLREGFEFCDGDDLAGQSCESQGFLAGVGELICRSDCAGFDTSGCIRADLCGNGTREGGEQCDGSDFRGATCRSRGFAEGDLACTAQCTFDESRCSGVNPCGNGSVDAGEQCDGDDLDGESCASLGFRGEGLACNATCDGFDVSACEVELCGNGLIDPGEVCDGTVFADGIGCQSEGFAGGAPVCNATCDGVDTAGCTRCGDNQIDPGETCDGSALNGRDCALEGFFGGTLACNDSCDGYGTSQCSDCGNGVIDEGEDCEASIALTESCSSLGYRDTPDLACGQDCRYDTSACSGFSECGNGILDGFASQVSGGGDVRLYQEFCDPGSEFWLVPIDFARFSRIGGCGILGLGSGDIGCTADCALDFSACPGAGGEANFCKVAGWWDDGTVCDPCDRIAGEADPDCVPPPLTAPAAGRVPPPHPYTQTGCRKLQHMPAHRASPNTTATNTQILHQALMTDNMHLFHPEHLVPFTESQTAEKSASGWGNFRLPATDAAG